MRIIGAVLLLLIGKVTFSQQKLLTIEDALVNNRTSLAAGTLRQLQFLKGSNDYVYLKKVNGSDVWVRGSFAEGEKDYLTLADFNRALRAASADTLTAVPATQFTDVSATFNVKGTKYSYDLKTGAVKEKVSKVLGANENLDISSAGHSAYVKNNNLYVETNNVAKQVTFDGSADIEYGKAVHQQEFGITKGIFWSNDGQSLVFYRMDQSMVPDYPIIDWTKRPAIVKNIRYPMAGDKSHHVLAGIYDTRTQKVTWINTGQPAEQFLTNIAWSKDDSSVFIAVLNREQNHMRLNEYNSSTGAFVKTLFEEQHDKYVEPLVPPVFLNDNSGKFIWQSRRDGWNHLYLYDRSGKLLRQLTKGNWEVSKMDGQDSRGAKIFFTSTIESPLSKNLSAVDVKTGKIQQLTKGNFIHNTSVSAGGDYVIDNFSSPDNARQIDLVELKTGKRKTIFNATDPLAAFSKGKMDIFTLKNAGGTELYCRRYLPVGFDSTKKYPVIVYWYGGPHAQLITNSWNGGSGDYWFQYMAQRGFIVMSLDTRGSSNRGLEFESAIFRNAGKVQREDLTVLVNYLKSLPYTDKDNMGLSGWSYGGFLTTSYLLENPGVFKAGVAGGPVMDWKYYEIMYTERYMDTPQENPEGYAATDLISKAGNLKDKLLLIHGLQDPVVVQQHSVNFVRAAIDKGVQVDYMIYPGHEHNVLGKDRAHLFQKISDYFIQHLTR